MKKPKMLQFKQIFDERFLKSSGYEWPEKKAFKFTWDYCGLCKTMFVRCPKCGNNCCSGGFGEVTKKGLPLKKFSDSGKGVTCDVCSLAYQYQDLAWMTKTTPKPTKKQIKDGEKQFKKEKAYMDDMFA